MDRAARRLAGSNGGYRSWVNTENRAQRMAVVQANSPTGLDWHARRLFGQDVDLNSLTYAR